MAQSQVTFSPGVHLLSGEGGPAGWTAWGIWEDFGCWPQNNFYTEEARHCCEIEGASCFTSERTRQDCCDVDRCPDLAWQVLLNLRPWYLFSDGLRQLSDVFQLLRLNIAYLARSAGGAFVFDLLGSWRCLLGLWSMRLLDCIVNYNLCGESLLINVSWAFVLETRWPIFWLLGVVAQQVVQGHASHESKPEVDLVQAIQAEVRALQSTENHEVYVQHVFNARKLVKNAQALWRGESSWEAWHSSKLWFHLSWLHWQLRHGFCSGAESHKKETIAGWLAVSTRHIPAIKYSLCVPSTSELFLLPAINAFGFWPDADIVASIFKALLPKGCGVVDVGANIGAVAFLLAKIGFTVLAIEADDKNVLALRAGARQLRREGSAGSVTVQHAAAAASAGYVSLSESATLPSIGVQVNWSSEGSVWGARLDDLAESFEPAVCAMKLDIEGSEHHAFLGATMLLAQVEVVFFEISIASRSMGVPSPETVLRMLPEFYFSRIEQRDFYSGRPDYELRPVSLRDACFSSGSWESWDANSIGVGTSRCGPVWNILATRRQLRGLPPGLPWVSVTAVDTS